MNKFRTANKKLIKKINSTAILNVIKKNGPISRADIAKVLSLNPATISSNVNDLIELRLIKEVGSGISSGGRKPILLRINSEDNFIVGVNTQLTHVDVAIVNMDGKIEKKNSYRYKFVNNKLDSDSVLTTIISAIEDIISSSNLDYGKFIGIGVGIHGLVDPKKGISIFAPAFKWHNIPIKSILEEKFNTKIIIDNDVRVMALGHKWFGEAAKNDNFALINLGEGIGGALVINGELYSGKTFGAGEIGHIKVTKRQYDCDCGNNGCLTTVASEEGIVERLKENVIKGEKSIFSTENINNITFEDVVNAANDNDELSINVIKNAGKYIGRAIGILINVFNPEKVILTGKILLVKDIIQDDISKNAYDSSIKENYDKTEIVYSTQEDLSVISAATLVLNDLFKV